MKNKKTPESFRKEIDTRKKKKFRTKKYNNQGKKLSHSRIAITEERIGALEVRSIEITQSDNRETKS